MIKTSVLLALALLASPVSFTEGLKPSSALSKLQHEIRGENDVNVHVSVNVNEEGKHPLHSFLNKGPHAGHNHGTPEAELDCFNFGGGGMSGIFSKLMGMFGGGNKGGNSEEANEENAPQVNGGSSGYEAALDEADDLEGYELNQGEHEGHNHETVEAELDCFGGGKKKKRYQPPPPPQPEEQSDDSDDSATSVKSGGGYEAEVDEAEVDEAEVEEVDE